MLTQEGHNVGFAFSKSRNQRAGQRPLWCIDAQLLPIDPKLNLSLVELGDKLISAAHLAISSRAARSGVC